MTDEGSVDYLPWRAPEVEDSRDMRPVDSEAARKLAWEQGYSDGYTIGIEAGTRDARQRMGYLHEILESLATPFRDLDENVAEQLTTLVRTLTQTLVRREVELDQTILGRLVDEAIETLPIASSQVRLVVNPDDAAFINEHMEQRPESDWRIQTDVALSRGDCRIHSDVTQIDVTVETRLARLVESMTDSQVHTDADS